MQLSIVIPCYNEAGNLEALHQRLAEVVKKIGLTCEFVFVDDGSTDKTREQLQRLNQSDPRVQAIFLSRNFGHQAALSAGIDHARGQAVVVMDADLQHPPEMIASFVDKWQQGYQMVYGYRRNIRPRWGYRAINMLIAPPIPPESADFRLMDRKVVEAFKAMPERARFIRGMITWLGFKQIGLGYEDAQRYAGQRAYTRRQTWRMALHAVLAFSSIPLRLASVLGMITLLAGVGYALYILYARLAGYAIEPGWTGLIMTVLILGGVQLLCLGIIAEYIGRIFEEVKHRPLYVIDQRLTGDPGPSAPNQPEPGSRP